MTDFDLSVSSVVLGGNAVANVDVTDGGVASDVDSVTAEWRDHLGVLLETLTRTTVDVAGTDSYGNASSLSDPAGTGTYRATLIVDATNYTPPTNGLTWTLTMTVVKGAASKTSIFPFTVIATTLAIELDSVGITTSVMRQVGIQKDIQFVANSAVTMVNLGSGPVYAIAAAYKNGSAITSPTAYAWSTYRTNVTLQAAAAANDHFTFTIQTRSTNFVMDIVNRQIQKVLRALTPHYDATSTAFLASPSLVEIVKALCIGQLRQDLAEGIAMESAWYRSGRDLQTEAKMELLRIQRGEEDIYDTAGSAIVRRSGTLVAGPRSAYLVPATRQPNRLDMLDRAQNYTGLFLTLHPHPSLNLTRGYTVSA